MNMWETMCDMTHSDVCVTWLIHVVIWLTSLCMCHDSFMCLVCWNATAVTYYTQMCEMNHSRVYKDSFVCVLWLRQRETQHERESKRASEKVTCGENMDESYHTSDSCVSNLVHTQPWWSCCGYTGLFCGKYRPLLTLQIVEVFTSRADMYGYINKSIHT